jgi:hypothetical protein
MLEKAVIGEKHLAVCKYMYKLYINKLRRMVWSNAVY